MPAERVEVTRDLQLVVLTISCRLALSVLPRFTQVFNHDGDNAPSAAGSASSFSRCLRSFSIDFAGRYRAPFESAFLEVRRGVLGPGVCTVLFLSSPSLPF